jgi:hypothetical protein
MTNKSLATLIQIEIPGSSTLRYQNYQSADYTYNGQPYSWLGFSVQSYSDSDLNLSSTDTTIAIRNTSTIQNLLRQFNGLKRSIVTIFLVDPQSLVAVAQRLIVSFSTVDQGQVVFTLRSATGALQGDLVTAKLDVATFPEIPYYRPQL